MASPFARDTQSAPITVPFDSEHSIVVRRLTGGEVEEAERVALRGFVNGKPTRGFSAHIARIFAGAGTDADAVKAANDPLKGYDRITLIRGGLVSWTYKEPIAPGVVDGVLVDAIDGLTDEAQEFMATEVARLTWPWKFQTVEQYEADRKNG